MSLSNQEIIVLIKYNIEQMRAAAGIATAAIIKRKMKRSITSLLLRLWFFLKDIIPPFTIGRGYFLLGFICHLSLPIK
jgi:hypothetical protein